MLNLTYCQRKTNSNRHYSIPMALTHIQSDNPKELGLGVANFTFHTVWQWKLVLFLGGEGERGD